MRRRRKAKRAGATGVAVRKYWYSTQELEAGLAFEGIWAAGKNWGEGGSWEWREIKIVWEGTLEQVRVREADGGECKRKKKDWECERPWSGDGGWEREESVCAQIESREEIGNICQKSTQSLGSKLDQQYNGIPTWESNEDSQSILVPSSTNDQILFFVIICCYIWI